MIDETCVDFLHHQSLPKHIEDINFLKNEEKTKLIQFIQSNSVFKLYSIIFDLLDCNNHKKSYIQLYNYFTQIFTKERSYVATIVFIHKIDAIFHIYDYESEEFISELIELSEFD